MLYFPGVVEAEPVGQCDLIECVTQELKLVVIRPRLGKLVFIEDPEMHRPSSPHPGPAATVEARSDPNPLTGAIIDAIPQLVHGTQPDSQEPPTGTAALLRRQKRQHGHIERWLFCQGET